MTIKSEYEIIQEGFKSGKYSANDYDKNSKEYDLFERGVTQRIKSTNDLDAGVETRESLLKSAADNKERVKVPKRSYQEMKNGE